LCLIGEFASEIIQTYIRSKLRAFVLCVCVCVCGHQLLVETCIFNYVSRAEALV